LVNIEDVMVKKYKHLFFDLDRTLWDFETNSKITLQAIYKNRQLNRFFSSYDDFFKKYHENNARMWDAYKLRQITKDELKVQRFAITLQNEGLEDIALAKQIAEDYVTLSPEQTTLFPYAVESLQYLKQKYTLHIITNGFVEVQYKKLRNTNLDVFFTSVTCSEEAQASKPNPKIFHAALTAVNARKTESLMIGDDWENDILGAQKWGMDQVFFNPNQQKVKGKATFEIQSLQQLQEIL